MPIKTGLLCFFLVCVPLSAQDFQVLAAVDEIQQAFRRHRFDPSIINAQFDRRRLDPRIIEIEWSGVRGHVEAALARLNVGIRKISLPSEFRPLPATDDHKGEVPHRLLPVFVFEKGNVRAKTALKIALGLRDDALWDYEPATGQAFVPQPVTETLLAITGDFKREYRGITGGLNLVNIHKGLQEILADKSLEAYHFQPVPAHIGPFGLHFATVWTTCCKTDFVAYGMRLKVTLERHPTQPDAWEMISKVEIGKRYASQADFRVVADSMKGDFLTSHVTVNKLGTLHDKGRMHIVMRPVLIPGEPLKAEVPPPIERKTAAEASTLELLVPAFANLCRRKLFNAVEIKP
jgi:hypothetical protein